MKCCKCKYLRDGITDEGSFNECKRFGFEYFHEFYEMECPYIDDDYELTEAGKEAEQIF